MSARGVQLDRPKTRFACRLCGGAAWFDVVAAPVGSSVQRMHRCPALGGLEAPMQPEGLACKVEVIERGDYIGDEHVQVDGNGRPVMAVRTTRDDGYDTAVYAPMAMADAREVR